MYRKKSLVCLILCLLVISQIFAINANAEEIQPRYTYISSIGATLTTNYAKTKLTISADLCSRTASTAVLNCSIQYYDDGYWRNLESWYRSDTKNVSLEQTYSNANPNYVYRLLVRAYVYANDGTLLDSDTIYQYTS